MFLGKPTDGAHCNLNPIMFLQLGRCCGKGIIGPKIGQGSLQGFGIPTALHLRRFGKGSNLLLPDLD